RSFGLQDLIVADAIFDEPDGREWSFEGLLVAHNPAHRWFYYPDMHTGEVIVFKSKDSDPQAARHIPHVAFNDPSAPADAPPRASIEMRATAYWWA
ncbi:MAG TPA: CmcJ/NvfI family oxidoreductase, partial [Novosphingobium sp.]|nr:CmcJ/NvfI family oxidoreductase [Novosphingobium sp.]